jgi:hypothetical protein
MEIRMGNGPPRRRKMENGKWRMEDGRWKREKGNALQSTPCSPTGSDLPEDHPCLGEYN